jgi:hypothetical protein
VYVTKSNHKAVSKMTIPKIERPADKHQIKIANPFEVNWWCIEFGTTQYQLIEAVNKVGISATLVKRHLLKEMI